ncbi:virus Gp157 [Ligilactobacillus sp. WC1T17]|uniref:Virus Gp157 n=1 Tax=Ligilactobacillus ruminis TaxID=1623 RepID=A0ABY1A9G2_9LACO|nr:virus Gp157 [Ligilactobacillus ruminis]
MNLFKLNQNFDSIVAMIDDEETEIDEQTLFDTLESIKLNREVTLDNIATLIEKNKAYATAYAEKVKSLQNEKKRLEKVNDSLQSYMTQAMDQAGLKELKTENHVLKPRNYKASVVVDDTSVIPEKYMVTKTTVTPDKTTIYKALKAGEEVPGAHAEPNRKTVIK